MFFYFMHRNRTLKELRKSASFTIKELSKLTGISLQTLTQYENIPLKDTEQGHRHLLISILSNEIGFF